MSNHSRRPDDDGVATRLRGVLAGGDRPTQPGSRRWQSSALAPRYASPMPSWAPP